MHIQLLTTDTPHHRYFAKRLKIAGMVDSILLETQQCVTTFPTRHNFELKRDEYEQKVLLSGEKFSFSELAVTKIFSTINSQDARDEILRLKPDLVFVFGTGLLKPFIINLPGVTFLNLHGGNPEEYRGLDSHLWAIYHRDFDNLVSTLHYMLPQLDAGKVVMSSSLPVPKNCELHELRSINTIVCVDMSLAAASIMRAGLPLPSRAQIRRGRYYSAMPTVLKDDCIIKFNKFSFGL